MDDHVLLAAAASGDVDAFAAFYRRHLNLVVAAELRSTADLEVAADLAAEVFELSSSGRDRRDHDTPGPRLIGIANNKPSESERRRRVQDGVRPRLQMRPLVFVDHDAQHVIELA
jgi:hypothetical protein